MSEEAIVSVNNFDFWRNHTQWDTFFYKVMSNWTSCTYMVYFYFWEFSWNCLITWKSLFFMFSWLDLVAKLSKGRLLLQILAPERFLYLNYNVMFLYGLPQCLWNWFLVLFFSSVERCIFYPGSLLWGNIGSWGRQWHRLPGLTRFCVEFRCFGFNRIKRFITNGTNFFGGGGAAFQSVWRWFQIEIQQKKIKKAWILGHVVSDGLDCIRVLWLLL